LNRIKINIDKGFSSKKLPWRFPYVHQLRKLLKGFLTISEL